MNKITINNIKSIHEKYKKEFESRQSKENNTINILVCQGTGCISANSDEIVSKFNKLIGDNPNITCSKVGCLGFCEKGPIVKIMPDNVFYVQVGIDDVEKIYRNLTEDNDVDELLYVNPENNETIKNQDDMPFYKKQMRIALRNCGQVNPEKIDDVLSSGVYLSLSKVLSEMTPEQVIDVVKESNIRGRGGGGFPTGQKWQFGRNATGEPKYIICNADEGDPGAFMDRSILEGDAHSVLEGMMIAGYAVGATIGYVYIRAEYPLAIERLKIAIEQAKQYGLLGDNILGTDFNFHIEIKYGAGAFICGEETALINSIEGRRGEPRNKPPFPANVGVFGKPTVVNNVETLVNIPIIIAKGGKWFKSIGTETSSGTKVFALSGKINNVGLVEVPMGLTLRELIYDIGGGVRDNKQLKAIQTGGPSGGCIPASMLDIEIDYDKLKENGSMMGSGGMLVLDEDNCMVELAKFYLEFTLDESCGKCTPCRIGNTRLYEILDKITKGKGTMDDLKKLEKLSNVIKTTSLCGLGQTSPNPVLSTLEHFYDEYLEHINNKNCPSGVCKDLLTYFITDKCIGCTKCARVCPANCISGDVRQLHVIDQDKCIKCDSCYNVCPVNAITKGNEVQA